MRLIFALAGLLVCVILLSGCISKKDQSTDEMETAQSASHRGEKNMSGSDAVSPNNLTVEEGGSEGAADNTSPHTGGPSASINNNELMPPPPPDDLD